MKLYEYSINGITIQYGVFKDTIQELNGYPSYKIMQQYIHNESKTRSLWFEAEDFKTVAYKTRLLAEQELLCYLNEEHIKYKERSIKNDERSECSTRSILICRNLDS